MKIEQGFDEFLEHGDILFYHELDDEATRLLGRYIFKHVSTSVRAEALVECDAFDKVGHAIFCETEAFIEYTSDVFLWLASAYQDEYDAYIRTLRRD